MPIKIKSRNEIDKYHWAKKSRLKKEYCLLVRNQMRLNKIKKAAKPNITAGQLDKAKKYIAAGGSIEAIESKYKLTDEQKANIKKTL